VSGGWWSKQGGVAKSRRSRRHAVTLLPSSARVDLEDMGAHTSRLVVWSHPGWTQTPPQQIGPNIIYNVPVSSCRIELHMTMPLSCVRCDHVPLSDIARAVERLQRLAPVELLLRWFCLHGQTTCIQIRTCLFSTCVLCWGTHARVHPGCDIMSSTASVLHRVADNYELQQMTGQDAPSSNQLLPVF